MRKRAKIFTHEVLVHKQVMLVEKLLKRTVEFEIRLNSRGERSNIQFEADEPEIRLIKSELGYQVMTYQEGRWLPSF